MDNRRLTRRAILVLTKDARLFIPVKEEIEKDGIAVRLAGSVHEAAMSALLTEPLLIAIELSPGDFSGLNLLAILEKIKPFRYFFYSFRESHHGFLHLYDQIHFLDEKGVRPVVEKIRSLLTLPAPGEPAQAGQAEFIENKGTGEDSLIAEIELVEAGTHPGRQDFGAGGRGRYNLLLEELDRLGVIRKK